MKLATQNVETNILQAMHIQIHYLRQIKKNYDIVVWNKNWKIKLEWKVFICFPCYMHLTKFCSIVTIKIKNFHKCENICSWGEG